MIGKLLAGRPEDRYAAAAAIREDLERVIAGQQTQAEREGWPTRAIGRTSHPAHAPSRERRRRGDATHARAKGRSRDHGCATERISPVRHSRRLVLPERSLHEGRFFERSLLLIALAIAMQ